MDGWGRVMGGKGNERQREIGQRKSRESKDESEGTRENENTK